MLDDAMASLEEVRRVKEEVEGELFRYPNVTGVGVGHKKTGGRKTDQLAIIVYVREKKDVPPEDAIPRTIRGIPTDVVERDIVLHSP